MLLHRANTAEPDFFSNLTAVPDENRNTKTSDSLGKVLRTLEGNIKTFSGNLNNHSFQRW